jgi:[acyl-carrier-protein] S-malonyltransferase
MRLDPDKTAFLFPGQGSQAVGMGAELASSVPAAASVFDQADQQLEFALSDLMWHGPEETLNETEFTQPALLVHSIAVLRAFQSQSPGFRPAYAAGHSLGEITALVAAGALDFTDGLHLVRERGLAMKEAGELNPGGMAAVLGLDHEPVELACQAASEQNEGGVWVANDNCPGQLVISGDHQALETATGLLEEAGARKVIRLAVSIAAHSPFMLEAAARFRRALDQVDITDPGIRVIGNVSAAPLSDASQVRQDLEAQLTSTVRWTESIGRMIEAGIDTFVELGSGDVLIGLVKRMDRSVSRIHLDTADSLSALSD